MRSLLAIHDNHHRLELLSMFGTDSFSAHGSAPETAVSKCGTDPYSRMAFSCPAAVVPPNRMSIVTAQIPCHSRNGITSSYETAWKHFRIAIEHLVPNKPRCPSQARERSMGRRPRLEKQESGTYHYLSGIGIQYSGN
jgi:hypothetical protein